MASVKDNDEGEALVLPEVIVPKKGTKPAVGTTGADAGDNDFIGLGLDTSGTNAETKEGSREHAATIMGKLGSLLGLSGGSSNDDPTGDDAISDPEGDAARGLGTGAQYMARGAVKGIASGLPQLYGLAGAIVDYAANHAAGGNTKFSDQLFKPGGIQAIMEEGQQFRDQYIQDNPGATVEDLHQAYDEHRATPEYYNFAAEQMRPGLSMGMKNAMAINQLTGDNTTPDNEDVRVQALEGIGSAILPLPGAGAIPDMAGSIAGRIAGKIAGQAAYGATKAASLIAPGNTGGMGSAVAGATISTAITAGEAYARSHHGAAVLSRGMIDPRNGEVVTSAASMSDPVEMAHRGPPIEQAPVQQQTDDTPPPQIPVPVGQLPNQQGGPVLPQQKPIVAQPASPQPAAPTIQPTPPQSGPAKVVIPQTINQPETFAGATPTTPGLIGGALAGIGAAAAGYGAIKYGHSAVQKLMNRAPVNVDAFAGVQGIRDAVPRAENIINSTAIRGNLNRPETAPSLPGRVLRAFDAAFNKDAPVEAQARDVGGDPLERIIQTQLGTKMSPGAKAADKARAMHSGLLPDGTHLNVIPEEFYSRSQALTQEQRTLFTQLIQGLNIQDRRTAGYNQLLNREQEIVTALHTANARSAANLNAERAEVQRLMRLRNADDPSSRITFKQVPDEVINSQITEARADPDLRALENMYRTISRNLTRFEYNSGVLTQAEATARYQNSHYSPLFEFEYRRKSDVAANNDLTDTTMPDAAPERAVDPWSAIAFKLSNAIDDGNTNTATSRIINAFRASDPNGRVVREVDKTGNAGTVTVYNNGRAEHYQFARPAVAEALKAQSLDVGPILQGANRLRTALQQAVTGPIFGTLYTPLRSVVFDAFATQATRRADRPFGIASYVAHRMAGQSPAARRAADLIGAVDPTGPLLVTPYGFANASLMHAYEAAGNKIAQMAANQSPVFRALGNIPGGQQTLVAMGARMSHAFDSSVVHLMENANAVHTHQMVRDTLSVRNELEGFMRKYQNAGLSNSALGRAAIDPALSTLRTLYNGYSGILNTIHNASRYGFAAQAYSLLQHRAAQQGRQVTDDEIRTLAEEVRRSAGDLAGQPGSRLLKQFEAATPYSNISFQSARHVIKAMQRDPMQVGLTMIGLSGAIYGSYKAVMSRGPEAQEWYWNKANPWERIGAIRMIPKPDHLLYMAQNGRMKPWDPHDPMGDFYDIAVSPELMPYLTTVMAGLEGAGVIQRPNDATSITKDMAFSLADSLAVGNQPILNAVTIPLTGTTINWTAGASGRAVMQPSMVARGSGANEGKTLSGAPAWIPQMMTATLGLAGTMAYNMIDQGVQAYKDGQSFGKVAQRVGLEGEEYLKERPAVPDVPFLYNAPAKVYRSTPASRRMSDLYTLVRGQLGKDRGLDAAWGMEFGKNSKGPLSATAPHVMDMQVLEMMAAVHAAYLKKGAIKDQATEANEMKKAANDYQRQKVKTPVEDIASGKFRFGLQSKLLDWQTKEDQVLAAAEDFNKQLEDQFGDRFKAEGVPPTVDGVSILVSKVARPLRPGEAPLSAQVPTGLHKTLVFPSGKVY